MLGKFVLITETIDAACKQAMTQVAWKQESVKQNTGGEPTIIYKLTRRNQECIFPMYYEESEKMDSNMEIKRFRTYVQIT